jgi:hypothetical protein
MQTYNLLAQRDNKLNITIAQASKKDSTTMRSIAIVTILFLPGAYIAVSIPVLVLYSIFLTL